jgi:SNF2 family DNA or RNA helicase
MKLSDIFRRGKSAALDQVSVEWSVDPSEGVDLFLPSELGNLSGGAREGLELAVLQAALLRSAEEQGLALRNHSGFTILSDEFVQFEPEFYELFDFPAPFLGTLEVSFVGNTTQASFSARPACVLPDGDRITTLSLLGPFLSCGGSELFRLDAPIYGAVKAILEHQSLDPAEKTEYTNGKLVLDLKTAQSVGAPVSLAHFESFEVLEPASIGVHAQANEGGDLVLTPTFEGVDVRDSETRWGQLRTDGSESLRVKNKLILLKEEAMEAVKEVLTSRRIPAEQVKSFLASPTAFISSAMIDLDTGFSLRVHGAERFELRYFGDTESLSQDWFSGDSKPEMPLSTKLASVKTEAELDDIQGKVEDAIKHGATAVEFENYRLTLENAPDPLGAVNQARESLTIPTPNNANEDSAEMEEALERSTLAIDDNDEELSFSGRFDSVSLHVDAEHFSSENLARSPYEHQEHGIKWILAQQSLNAKLETGGALLADDMGLGKTYMTLVALAESMRRDKEQGRQDKPHLIVAPVSLLLNWKDEVAKTFKRSPFQDIVILQAGEELSKYKISKAGKETLQSVGSEGVLESPDLIRHSLKIGPGFGAERLDQPGRLVLTTYQTLRDYQFSMARVDWGMAVFDEAQNLKNPNALVTRAAKGLKADFKLVATGTPVENSLKDFWCLMDTCTPGLLGSWQNFRESYIQPILEAGNNLEIKQQVGATLRQQTGDFMLRRTKAECLDGLPSKRIWVGTDPFGDEKFSETLSAVMPARQKAAYDSVVAEVRSANPESKRAAALAALNSLRNVCIHPNLGPQARSGLPLAEDSGKMLSVLKLIEGLRTKQEKCIIFLISKRAQALLAASIEVRFGIEVNIVNGDTKTTSKKSEETRAGIIEQFQGSPGFGVIIMSPVAAGVGLTVTAANNVIHLERHWNPAKEAQATDRVYRIGQEKEVNVYLPIAVHPEMQSFDERLNLLLRNKTDLSSAVVSPDSVSEDEMFSIFQ